MDENNEIVENAENTENIEKVEEVEEVKNTENVESPKTCNNNKWIIIGIITVAIVLLIVGCFALGKWIIERKTIVGYYELYEMSSGEQSYTHEDLESLKTLGLTVNLELREDKTGTLSLFGDTMDLTYNNKNMTIDGESAPYKIKDGKLSMEQDGDKLVFEKAEKKENSESTEKEEK